MPSLKVFTKLVCWVPRVLFWRLRLWDIKELIWFGNKGIGDDLLCTAVLREMYKRGRRDVAMMSNYPELFKNLPYPKKIIPFKYGALRYLSLMGIRTLKPAYMQEVSTQPQKFIFRNRPLIQAMCESVGLEGPVELCPEFRLTEIERNKYQNFRGGIAVQTSRQNPKYPLANKEWVQKNWGQLGNLLAGMGNLVQVGSVEDPELPGAMDLKGKTPSESWPPYWPTCGFLSDWRVF